MRFTDEVNMQRVVVIEDDAREMGQMEADDAPWRPLKGAVVVFCVFYLFYFIFIFTFLFLFF